MKRVEDLRIKWGGGNGIDRGREASKHMMNQNIIFLILYKSSSVIRPCLEWDYLMSRHSSTLLFFSQPC